MMSSMIRSRDRVYRVVWGNALLITAASSKNKMSGETCHKHSGPCLPSSPPKPIWFFTFADTRGALHLHERAPCRFILNGSQYISISFLGAMRYLQYSWSSWQLKRCWKWSWDILAFRQRVNFVRERRQRGTVRTDETWLRGGWTNRSNYYGCRGRAGSYAVEHTRRFVQRAASSLSLLMLPQKAKLTGDKDTKLTKHSHYVVVLLAVAADTVQAQLFWFCAYSSMAKCPKSSKSQQHILYELINNTSTKTIGLWHWHHV